MAAGLGFKTFTTGEVLTAADVNGYLMQGILVFANATARDAAITSPQEGQCCYLKDTDAVLTYSGSAWVGFDDSNAIQNSIINAKGDLISGSANDTPAILSVGSNGETLVADSSTSTGLRYQGSMAAGRNFIINGGFDIWQRGTSVAAIASSNPYTSDRWKLSLGANASYTVSRQATGDTTNLPFVQYAARVQRDSGQTGTNIGYFIQGIETVNAIPLAGKSITFSFYARKGANYSAASDALSFSVAYGTGTDQDPAGAYTGQTNAISTSVTLTSTWQRFTATATMATTATEIKAFFNYTPVGTAGANDYYEITGVQLEVGSVATQFSRAGGNIAGELVACQRYYYRISDTTAYNAFGVGQGNSTTLASLVIPFPVTMRAVPTVLDYSLLGVYDGATITNISSAVINGNQTGRNSSYINLTGTGLTQYRPYVGLFQNNNAGYLGFGAEL